MKQLEIEGIPVIVDRKKIKSLNLYVKAPDGHVRVSAPMRTSDRVIRNFVVNHMDWIEKQQKRVRARCVVCRYETGEMFPVFGERKTLIVRETALRRDCGVEQRESELVITAPENSTTEQREKLLRDWQREQLKQVSAELLGCWSKRMRVHVKEWHIKRMKTRWGTCNCGAQRIWLNLSLAEQPMDCVEYVVVHELCHLIEPSHSKRFWNLMTKYLPDWQERRIQLNRKTTEQTES